MNKLQAYLRGVGNLGRFSWVVMLAAWDFAFDLWLCGKSSSVLARAKWLQRWSQRVLADLNIRVERRGNPPSTGLLVSNHLSYLDIIILAAAQPMVFVAKSEIRRWPVLGRLARWAGTLFVRRDRRSDVAKFDGAFAEVVKAGVILVMFPEGTSSDGQQVLPFYSSLFEPAVSGRWPVSAARIGYTLPGGSVENEICYWGDMTFLPHFLHLLTREKITASVVYGSTRSSNMDRKQLARRLHEEVCELAGPTPLKAEPPEEKSPLLFSAALLGPQLDLPPVRQST